MYYQVSTTADELVYISIHIWKVITESNSKMVWGGEKLYNTPIVRGLSQKFVDTHCFHPMFNIYNKCCISTERLINADFIDTEIVKIV